MNKFKFLLALMFVTFIVGCSSSQVSKLPISKSGSHPVKAIALAPEGGMLAEAVGIELANLGFTIIDSSTTSKLMVRLGLNEVEIATPQGLRKLKDNGIDAYLTVKSASAYDYQVQSASARASSTHTGRIIAGVTWQNGWGGMAGSIADRTMRKGFAEAAQDIAKNLAQSMPLPN